METVLVYADQALRYLETLDRHAARRIMDKLEFYAGQDDPLAFAKMLTGGLCGLYRYRVGEYRVIFQKDTRGQVLILDILRIGHRKDIYE